MLRPVHVLVPFVSAVYSLRISQQASGSANPAASQSVRDVAGDDISDDRGSQYRDLEVIRLAHPVWYDLIMQTRLATEAQARVQSSLGESSSKSSKVTVIGNSKTRILQFEPGLLESKVLCEESCEMLPHEVDVAAECQGCPCTVVEPYLNMCGYLRQPVDHVVERYRTDTKPQNILVVGLGGGSMVDAIRSLCEVRMVQIIEISETVIHANKLFFGLNASVVTSEEALSDNVGVQVFQGDGEYGVQVMAHKFPHTFDTVFVDCMSAGRIPPGCKSDAFYASISKLLSPSAYIYQWNMGLNDKDKVEDGIGKHIGIPTFLHGWVRAAKQ